MNDYLQEAMNLRQKVAEIDEAIDVSPLDEQKSDRLWKEHVDLLKKVYPKPNPQDPIQVTILDTYYDDAVVLDTSFSDIESYNKALEQFSWDYELESEQVGCCELCSEQYLVRKGCQDKDGRGFCKQECLTEDKLERQIPVDDGEYDLFYDYCFPDGDLIDREKWWHKGMKRN